MTKANIKNDKKNDMTLWLLTVAIFAVGSAELLPMGLLLPIAEDTGVSITRAGMLVTAYALAVVVGGPVLTAVFGSLSRKTTLAIFVSVFAGGSALTAFALTYEWLLVGRVASALAQGVLFGVIVVMAKDLAAPGKEGRNIALVSSGLTVAVVLGSPLGTLTGEQFGWRVPFMAVGLLALGVLLGLKSVPAVRKSEPVPIADQLRIVSGRSFLLALLVTVFGTGGTFAALTYIAPILERNAGVSGGTVSAVLLVFGVGSVVGNGFGGRMADRRLYPALLGGLLSLSASMALFAWASRDTVAAFLTALLWGAAAYSIMTPLNIQVLRRAKSAQELASTLNISAFNLGNALGSFAGGAVIDSPLGLSAVPWCAALITLVGLGLAIFSARADQRAPTTG